MMKDMTEYITKVIIHNDNHAQAIQQLLQLLNKSDAYNLVSSFKANTELPPVKKILVDDVIHGLHRLLDIHPHIIK